MKKLLLITTLWMTSALGASAQSILVDESFSGAGFSWSRGNGALTIRYRAIEIEGEIYLCGATAYKGGATAGRFSREALRLAKITLNGSRVKQNLRWFNTVSSRHWDTRLEGQEADCRSMDMAAGQANLSDFRVEFYEGRYRISR